MGCFGLQLVAGAMALGVLLAWWLVWSLRAELIKCRGEKRSGDPTESEDH